LITILIPWIWVGNIRHNLTASGAASEGFWGILIGMIFLNPLIGVAAGAAGGAIGGVLADVGINDDFMK